MSITMKTKVNVKKEICVNIAKLSIGLDANDVNLVFYGENDEELINSDYKNINFLPTDDDNMLYFNININTGKILNWKIDKMALQKDINDWQETE